MKTLPVISIVIINYKGFDYLKRTIAAVKEFTYENYEIVVVDNGEDTECLRFLKNCSEVTLLKSPQLREKNFACNYGVQNAQGEYILLLDNDVIFEEKYLLQNLLETFSKAKKVGCLALAFRNENEQKTKGYGNQITYFGGAIFRKKLTPQQVKTMHLHQVSAPCGEGGIFFKKKVWREIGGYDEQLPFGGDDKDIGIRSMLYGYKNYLYAKTLSIHTGIAKRTDAKKFSWQFTYIICGMWYVIIKNFRFPNMCISLVCTFVLFFLRSIKQSVMRLSLLPLGAFLRAIFLLFYNLPEAIRKRKKLQVRRVIADDLFLEIKPQMARSS